MNVIPFPQKALFDESLQPYHRDTLLHVMNLCWRSKTGDFDWSEPLTYSGLESLFNKSRQTIQRHIELLKQANYIDLKPLSGNLFALRPSTNTTVPVHGWTQVSTREPTTIKDSLINKSESLKDLTAVGPPVDATVHPWTPNEELGNFLKSKGVTDPTRTKIAVGDFSMDYVRQWFKYGELNDWPISHILRHILDHMDLPNFCPDCGGIETHEWACGERMVRDYDGNFISQNDFNARNQE